jgi:SAM-dependent methyltransferase
VPPSVPALPLGAGAASDGQLIDRFVAEVRAKHLAEWLPVEPSVVLDLSQGCPGLLALMIEAGHTVLHSDLQPRRPDIRRNDSAGGRLLQVHADPVTPDYLADESLDAIVAEGCTLSSALAAELTLERLCTALRPGGRLLLCVDSLVAGLAHLAETGRWAELADVPAADVVLIPGDSGRVTRCFWPEELSGILTGAGFTVDWIRPRSVLTDETLVRALRQDSEQLDSLVATELALEVRRQSESIGTQLLVSAHRPPRAAGS